MKRRQVLSPKLRLTIAVFIQEYIIVAGLALAEALSGLTFFVAGIWRTSVVLFGYRNAKV